MAHCGEGRCMVALWMVMALAAEPAVPTEVWAGHQRTVGVRKVPILGEIKTVTDVYMLSKVEDRGTEIVLVETPCRIEIKSQGGVKLGFDPAAVQNIAPPTIRFVEKDGLLV